MRIATASILSAWEGYAMRTFLPALAIAAGAAAALSAAPAQAVTFSKLTTIYIASGVFDSGGAANTGVARRRRT
jgi:hypothetical protein